MVATELVGTTQEVRRANQMKGRRPLRPGAIVTVSIIVLVLGVLAGGILGHVSTPPVVTTSGTDHLYLTIAYNPYTGLDQYFPANFSVPANVPVVITITNYDNGTNLVPVAYAKVLGTVDGTETVTNATASDVSVTSVPTTGIAHTFTLITGPYAVNIPIPAAQDQTPTVVTFTAVFATPGQFVWHCMAPCDSSAMDTLGFMMGTVTVVGS